MDNNNNSLDKTITHVIYGLLLAGVLSPIPLIFGAVAIYYKKKDISGTMLESHFDWLILTFWVAFIAFLIGALTKDIGLGYVLIFGASVWLIYRVVMGWRALYEGKEIIGTNNNEKTSQQ